MKKTFTLALSIYSIICFSQPIIQNANNVPAVGVTVPLSTATTTNVGNAGANQTWDYSSLTFSPVGNLAIITPSSSPFGASFPSANWAYSVAGAAYTFFENTSTEMKNLASLITSPGGNDDYSANPKTIMQFPFNFNDSFSDTYTEQGSTSTVTVTYDGYGTLIMPNGNTYTNVVRVKEAYSSSTDYRWYTTNPLVSVAVFNDDNNLLYWIGTTPSSITEKDKTAILNIFPNPANEKLSVKLSNLNFSETTYLNIINSLGQIVKQTIITTETTIIDTENVSSGIYFIQVEKDGIVLDTQKIIIE